MSRIDLHHFVSLFDFELQLFFTVPCLSLGIETESENDN